MADLLYYTLQRLIVGVKTILTFIFRRPVIFIYYIVDNGVPLLTFVLKLSIALIATKLIISILPYDMITQSDLALPIIMLWHFLIALISAFLISYKRNDASAIATTFIIILFCPYLAFFIIFVPRTVFYLRKEIRHHLVFENKDCHIGSVFALAGMATKCCGKFTRDENTKILYYLISYFNGINPRILNQYQGAFEFGRNHPEIFKEFAIFIADNYPKVVRMQTMLLLMLIAINEDKSFSYCAEEFLIKVAFTMGLSREDFEFVEKCAAKKNYFPHKEFNSQSTDILIKKYRAVLGVNEQASFWAIQKAYQKLIKEYDPNNYRNKPREYFYMAENKIREINIAYEYLAEIRATRFDY